MNYEVFDSYDEEICYHGDLKDCEHFVRVNFTFEHQYRIVECDNTDEELY